MFSARDWRWCTRKGSPFEGHASDDPGIRRLREGRGDCCRLSVERVRQRYIISVQTISTDPELLDPTRATPMLCATWKTSGWEAEVDMERYVFAHGVLQGEWSADWEFVVWYSLEAWSLREGVLPAPLCTAH